MYYSVLQQMNREIQHITDSSEFYPRPKLPDKKGCGMQAPNLAVRFGDIEAAAKRLANVAHRTPVLTSKQANLRASADVFFKCENFQRGGAFKFRGAYNAISCLSTAEKRRGVVAFSSGNHAQGIALAARMLGVGASIVMPSNAPLSKIAATRDYGAEIILYDRESESREAIAKNLADDRGLTLIPSFDHRDVIAGQGTSAMELFEEVGPLDYLFVCTGGGGLLAGSATVSSHLSPDCKVYGVEPELGNDAQQSLRTGSIVTIDVPDTIADGAQVRQIGELVLPILQAYVEDIVTVTDRQLCQQMRFFAERMKMVVEATGCLAAAAVMNNVVNVTNARVGVIVSGGNIDMDAFAHFIS
jgi:threonine dehydratase